MSYTKRVLVLSLCLVALFAAGAEQSGKDTDSYDVVVIGAGGGGLSAAARLSLAGFKVLLLEQHYKVGGYMTSFRREDYVFEVSLHAMNGLGPGGMTTSVFEELGIMDKVKPIRLDPVYTAVYPDFSITVPADPAMYKKELMKLFPGEEEAIEKMFKAYQRMSHAILIREALDAGHNLEAMSLTARHPDFSMPMIKYGSGTFSEMLEDITDNQKLAAVFSWMCGYGGAPPEELPAMLYLGMTTSYHYEGYYYFEGGSQAVSDALAEVIRHNGGKVELKKLVTKIKIRDGSAVEVVTDNGNRYKCRYVVSNASAPSTLLGMVGEEYLPGNYVRDLKSREIGPSAFQIYLGVKKDYRDRFFGGHTISVFESYDMSDMIDMADPEKQCYFLVNYSAVNPDCAPPGKNVIAVTAFLPYDWKEGWYESDSYEKYDKLKEETAMVFLKRAEKFLPGLIDNIEVMEVGSPRTMEHYTLNPKGAIYGWKINMEQTILEQFDNRTPIGNLYLAGAWTKPGHGQSMVLTSGIKAAHLIMKEEGIK